MSPRSEPDPSRRDFLRTAALGAAYAGLSRAADILPVPPQTDELPHRTLGRTGQQVSIVGMGGAHLGKPPDEDESIRLVRGAIDRGITFMDNSCDYNRGKSEIPL